ncbi:MAG TPA: uracil-DNA glycosylase family protein [Candidatus Limnocylindrales bacterium]|nr:uracil-DNA glycosylase family protein [Candidatus Limnocylindrales bacterium]
MTPEERRRRLEAIASEVSTCTRCPLSVGRTNAVPGEGSAETEVVFVGEGPGFNEDQQGRPFVGAAGTLLNSLIRAIGWRREDVFITNVVKCRPPGNRDPEPAEIAACAPYLRRQLEVLDPALVITLGRHSMQTFMPGARIGQAHGTLRQAEPGTGARDASVLAMYHPAAALRQNSLRETMLEDMARAPQALIDSRARRDRTSPQSGAEAAETLPQARMDVQAPAAGPPVEGSASMAAPESPATAGAPEPPVSVPQPDRRVAIPVNTPVLVEPAAVAVGEPVPENQMELF